MLVKCPPPGLLLLLPLHVGLKGKVPSLGGHIPLIFHLLIHGKALKSSHARE